MQHRTGTKGSAKWRERRAVPHQHRSPGIGDRRSRRPCASERSSCECSRLAVPSFAWLEEPPRWASAVLAPHQYETEVAPCPTNFAPSIAAAPREMDRQSQIRALEASPHPYRVFLGTTPVLAQRHRPVRPRSHRLWCRDAAGRLAVVLGTTPTPCLVSARHQYSSDTSTEPVLLVPRIARFSSELVPAPHWCH
jgi:hypothetical protein